MYIYIYTHTHIYIHIYICNKAVVIGLQQTGEAAMQRALDRNNKQADNWMSTTVCVYVCMYVCVCVCACMYVCVCMHAACAR